jgi:hypothetical protein
MVGTLEGRDVAKHKRSEARKHTAMLRVDADTLDRAKLAASLMRLSLADYASDVLLRQAEKDIAREARKLAGTEGGE